MTTLDPDKKPVQNYPLMLTTLTPVCVKSHEEPLSPLADYVCKGDRIHFVNPSKFMIILNKKNLIEEYAEMISAVNTQREGKQDKFLNFLEKNNISIPDISDESRPCSIQGNFTQISRHIRSAGRVYIPGSTLKGTITTVLFYDWMGSNEELWKDKIGRILENYSEQRNNLSNGGIDAGKDSFELNCLKNETKKKLDKEYNFLFDRYLNRRKSDNTFNYASFYGFEDSSFVNKNDLEIASFFRHNINPKNRLNPQLFEVIKKDVSLNTILTIQKSDLFKSNDGTGPEYKAFEETFFKSKELISFFKILNDFSLSYITFQIEFISNINAVDETSILDRYLNRLLDLKKEIKDIPANSAIVTLGFGKSFLQTTITLLLDNEMKKYLLSLNKNASDKKIAPKTFYMNEEGYPLGWIKVTDENEMAYKEKIDLPDYKIENLHEGDQIKGILLEKGFVGSVQISLNGVAQEVKANGLSKYEKFKNIVLKVDQLYLFQIRVIRNSIIKEIKII